jgi:DNA (cytosine-5)-methyltransferase 1
MGQRRLLDLYGCQGGMAFGYMQAGFHVTSVDINPQPRNPADVFIQADALQYLAEHWQEFDAYSASPPCQFACALRSMPNCRDREYHNWIPATRTLLRRTGKPYVIENVEQARKHLIDPIMLCGTMFGLRTTCGAQLRRHRLFETNFFVMRGLVCQHCQRKYVSVYGGGKLLTRKRTA